MCRHPGLWLGGAGRREGSCSSEACMVAGGESDSLRSAVLFSVFSLSVSLLLLFLWFAVLLNCPCADPPVSACFFPFSSAPQRGEGQQSGRVALLLPATTKL